MRYQSGEDNKKRFTGADIYFEESLDSSDKVDLGR
jgi:hypothetical protein